MVEWQSLKMQEYRYTIFLGFAKFFALFGILKPLRYEKGIPVSPGEFEDAINHKGPDSFLSQYLESKPKHKPRVGGAPKGMGDSEDEE